MIKKRKNHEIKSLTDHLKLLKIIYIELIIISIIVYGYSIITYGVDFSKYPVIIWFFTVTIISIFIGIFIASIISSKNIKILNRNNFNKD